jgi:hypothetical protein
MELDSLIVIAAAVAIVADLLAVGEVVWHIVRRLSRKRKSRPEDGS